MISSSVAYDQPVKYSYEIPNEYLSGSMAIFILAYVAIYSDSFIFGKATSSHFFRIAFFKVSQELLFLSSFFFRAAAFLEELLFQNSHFFSAYFSEQLLFQSETSIEKPHPENRKFFSTVTFRNTFPQTTPTQELLFRSRFFCTASTFFLKKKILEKATFSEKQYSA